MPHGVSPYAELSFFYNLLNVHPKILLQVGDDGSVLAATEDDVFQSLVGGSDNGLSFYNPEGGDTIGDSKEEESECVASDGNDSNGRTNISMFLPLIIFLFLVTFFQLLDLSYMYFLNYAKLSI